MKHSASFRDPSGFIFTDTGQLYRQVNLSYKEQYEQLISTGLSAKLIAGKLLIPFKDVGRRGQVPEICYKVIQPELVDFISYPYEWSFHQLKDAALATLRVQRKAIAYGMILKDASAYNIQFLNGSPILIDTLSFEVYQDGMPWDAYGQFCRHFLAPLALMSYRDVRLNQLMKIWIDGIPLDLAARLLPFRARLNAGLQSHVYLHAAAQEKYSSDSGSHKAQQVYISKAALESLVYSLENTIRKLDWKGEKSEWGDYYEITNYSVGAFGEKKQVIEKWIKKASPKNVWDMGGNNGEFSRLASDEGIKTVCFDIDPIAVDRNYLQVKSKSESNLLPLILDLTNPSGAIGWANQERMSFEERGPVDLVLALALIHHLSISNNVPLEASAEFFSRLGKWLIIEFVPKEDSQVQILLANRKDIFAYYTKAGFEEAFGDFFEIKEQILISGSKRTLYLMKVK